MNYPPPAPNPYLAPRQPELVAPSAGVSVGEAVGFVFRAKDWPMQLLYGLLLIMIPIVGPITLAGWFAEIHQRLLRGHPNPIPSFDFKDFGHYLTRGLTPFFAPLLVALPVIILVQVVASVGVFALVALSQQSGAEGPVLAIGLITALLLFVAMMVFGVFMNAVVTRAETCEHFGTTFNLSALSDYSKRTAGRVIVKSIVFAFVATGLVLLGLLAFFVGIYVVIVVLQFAQLHLRWQIHREYLQRGGPPLPTREPQWLPSEGGYAAPGMF